MRDVARWGLLVALLAAACVVTPRSGSEDPLTLEEAAAVALEGPQRASIHLVIRAAQSLEGGELGTARETASRALRIDGRNPYAYFVLAQVAAESDEGDAAFRYLEQAQLLFSLTPTGHSRWIARVLRLEADLREREGDDQEALLLRRQANLLDAGRGGSGSLLRPVLESEP